MAIVEHFEIPVDDIARAQEFYRSALGFDYEPWGPDMGMINQPEGRGINGDLHLRGATPHPTVVFTVDDIEAAVRRVVDAGGSQLGPIQPMSEVMRWVYVRDTESNIIGLVQHD